MKFVLSLALLGVVALSCNKKTETSTTTTDSTVVTTDSVTTVTPAPSDTIPAVDTTSAVRTDTMKTAVKK
ncbi:hypothetical protein [Chryseobacterium sp. MMS23-Vi53]|uniref:hypothetical protein n=1 Tax=Chryseobacterium sp. MMS23-Vi53 TaxID=3386644 RepID=UPI0039E9E196